MMVCIGLAIACYLFACFCFYKAGWHGGKAAVYQEWLDWSRAHFGGDD